MTANQTQPNLEMDAELQGFFDNLSNLAANQMGGQGSVRGSINAVFDFPAPPGADISEVNGIRALILAAVMKLSQFQGETFVEDTIKSLRAKAFLVGVRNELERRTGVTNQPKSPAEEGRARTTFGPPATQCVCGAKN